jgi:hypothetical protein
MKDTTIRLTIDLYCSGGLDEAELGVIARAFADGETDRRGEIEGLHGSVLTNWAINRRGAILDRLAVLSVLDAEKAARVWANVGALRLVGADPYWFSDAAADLLEDLELAIEDAEADEFEPENPHDAEMDEAALSLHDPDTDLLDCYS